MVFGYFVLKSAANATGEQGGTEGLADQIGRILVCAVQGYVGEPDGLA